MKLTLYMAMSIDGIVALSADEDISAYSSREDREFFLSRLKTHDAVITGRVSARHAVSLPRFVLTRTPRAYAADTRGANPAPTTYLCGTPAEICAAVSGAGYANVALLGGPAANHGFLRDSLVDELFLTVEPVMLGRGRSLNVQEELRVRWTLRETLRLNDAGTLVLHYSRR